MSRNFSSINAIFSSLFLCSLPCVLLVLTSKTLSILLRERENKERCLCDGDGVTKQIQETGSLFKILNTLYLAHTQIVTKRLFLQKVFFNCYTSKRLRENEMRHVFKSTVGECVQQHHRVAFFFFVSS